LRYTQEIRIQAIDSEWAYSLPETTTWAGKVIGELKSNGRQILYVFGVSLEHITLPTTTEDRCLAQKNLHKKFQLKQRENFIDICRNRWQLKTIGSLWQIHNTRCIFAYLFLNCCNSGKLNLNLSCKIKKRLAKNCQTSVMGYSNAKLIP
jgi:hypothetical protein